jgi:hypothetical protein
MYPKHFFMLVLSLQELKVPTHLPCATLATMWTNGVSTYYIPCDLNLGTMVPTIHVGGVGGSQMVTFQISPLLLTFETYEEFEMVNQSKSRPWGSTIYSEAIVWCDLCIDINNFAWHCFTFLALQPSIYSTRMLTSLFNMTHLSYKENIILNDCHILDDMTIWPQMLY